METAYPRHVEKPLAPCARCGGIDHLRDRLCEDCRRNRARGARQRDEELRRALLDQRWDTAS